jgi:hypothetical protein
MCLTQDNLKRNFLEYIEGYVPIYFITLNEKRRREARNSNEYEANITLDKAVVLMTWLKGFMLGKNELNSNGLFRTFIVLENSVCHTLPHVHIIVATKVNSRRTLDDVRNFIFKKWVILRNSIYIGENIEGRKEYKNKKIYLTKDALNDQISSVNVKVVDDINGLLDYTEKSIFWTKNNLQYDTFTIS